MQVGEEGLPDIYPAKPRPFFARRTEGDFQPLVYHQDRVMLRQDLFQCVLLCGKKAEHFLCLLLEVFHFLFRRRNTPWVCGRFFQLLVQIIQISLKILRGSGQCVSGADILFLNTAIIGVYAARFQPGQKFITVPVQRILPHGLAVC